MEEKMRFCIQTNLERKFFKLYRYLFIECDFWKSNFGLHILIIFMLAKFQEYQKSIKISSIKF